MEIEQAKIKLKELVEQFRFNIKQYKSINYDEANTRVDFIDKFFELLGWDVRNLQGFSEQYREVVREDKIQIEGKQKAPDYSFRIGKERKFFVEAKKPSVNVKEEIDPAFQVRRYGYTAKLPLSILTDFEEFAVYDTRIKPDKNDKASVGRIFYCTYEEYDKHFEFIYNTFSKNAILKGSFDRYIEENKNKKGTSEVDKELLKLVEEWRKELAKNIALRNNEIDIYNLNIAVQKIIDRIIFLRIAEDKEIEEYEQLLSIAKSNDIYKNLNELFLRANRKYNAGLFQPESWLSELKIDDKVLAYIIKGLYYPECPYEFSILPIEILGNIYEQFLGKTIKFRNVKEGHTAVIEEKPEVRKAGGVYYTPQYIVNYIVENTIGEKIKDKTPDEISEIKICDPACGSGSFLVGAYQYLLNYHLDYYTNPNNLKKALKEEKIYQVSEDSYKLTIEEKQRILINNIYGVDIDPQAVEVTKLSLYLKLMENEGKEAEGFLFKHSDLKLLPTLDNNIKCGNSLIGSDFYNDKDLSLFGNDELRKVNAFDWEKEFPEIFKRGGDAKGVASPDTARDGNQNRGFDIVIGNPPYGADLTDEERKYLQFIVFKGDRTHNSAAYFIYRAIDLLNFNGFLSFIVPKQLTYITSWSYTRSELLKYNINVIIDVSEAFSKVELEQVIFVLEKNISKENLFIKVGYTDNSKFITWNTNKIFFSNERFIIWANKKNENIFYKMLNNSRKLSDFAKVNWGGNVAKFISKEKKQDSDLLCYKGKDLRRYYLKDDIGYIDIKNINESY